MARRRMIDPEFWLDEELASLTPHARLLYIGLWSICDDNYATLPNRPEWIKAQILPYESVNIPLLLGELSNQQKIILFLDEDNKEFWYIKNFLKHQRVEKPSKSKYAQFNSQMVTTPVILPDYSPTSRVTSKVKISKVKISKDKLSEAQPKKYASIKDITEEDIYEISEQYQVTNGFVNYCLERLKNYCSSKGKIYSNYKGALKNFVLSEASKRNEKINGDQTKRGIDATDL